MENWIGWRLAISFPGPGTSITHYEARHLCHHHLRRRHTPCSFRWVAALHGCSCVLRCPGSKKEKDLVLSIIIHIAYLPLLLVMGWSNCISCVQLQEIQLTLFRFIPYESNSSCLCIFLICFCYASRNKRQRWCGSVFSTSLLVLCVVLKWRRSSVKEWWSWLWRRWWCALLSVMLITSSIPLCVGGGGCSSL